MTATNYIWDFATDSYLMEKDDGGNTTAVYTGVPVHYGKIVSERRNATTHYYHVDAQGSTRQVTDEAANVSDAYNYTAYGEVFASVATTDTAFRFCGIAGYISDIARGTIYIRRRMYDPVLGRWQSVDPITDDVNRYCYVGARPIDRTDPSGTIAPMPGEWPEDRRRREEQRRTVSRICAALLPGPGLVKIGPAAAATIPLRAARPLKAARPTLDVFPPIPPPPPVDEESHPPYPACCAWRNRQLHILVRVDVRCNGRESLFQCCFRHAQTLPQLQPSVEYRGVPAFTHVGPCEPLTFSPDF
jgi:RHS repeat-associated protein